MAGIELGRRVARVERIPKIRQRSINSTRAAIDYCSEQFSRLAYEAVQEEFHLVTLDTKHKPINRHQITVGTLDASLVHPRDIMVTQQLTEAGKILGIAVLDHIVVASEHSISIRETTLHQANFEDNAALQLVEAQ